MSNDQWLDDQVRAAYEQVVLPKSSLQRLKKQAQRQAPPSRMWIAALLVAAALAVAIVAAWPDPATVAPLPSPGVPVPMPLPSREEPPALAPSVLVLVEGQADTVLVDGKDVFQVWEAFEIGKGAHTFALRDADGTVHEASRIEVTHTMQVIELDRDEGAPPAPAQPVQVMVLGNTPEVVIDDGQTRPTLTTFTLPEGKHSFRLKRPDGVLGDSLVVRVTQGGIIPMTVVLPDLVVSVPGAQPPSVEGLWIGATNKGLSLKLTVLGQSGTDFEGTVELQMFDGSFRSMAIEGTVDANGKLSISGEDFGCSGKAQPRQSKGTCRFEGRPFTFTLYGS
jgi:hypothetical protein